MENKNQYNQKNDTGEIRATKPDQITTRTATDIKLQQLEDQINNQHQQILKLRRDISRIKSDVDDVISILNQRG